MKKAIFFDVDDTLYDQVLPFKQAMQKNFSLFNDDIIELFKISRTLSDELFEVTQSGEMDTLSMQIYRIKQALAVKNFLISDEQAIQFQKDYEMYQRDIQLSPKMCTCLELLRCKNILIGIITNGPSEHQWQKINCLKLCQFIPEHQIIVSADVGISKPNQAIFQLAQESLKQSVDEIYYVGDSFENDVIGANRAGWKTIWMNHRCRKISHHNILPDFIVSNEDELYNVLVNI